jgi:hypothetical protein
MGQHKHNPNCQLAKEGKLPPKPKKQAKKEVEREIYAKCAEYFLDPWLKGTQDNEGNWYEK